MKRTNAHIIGFDMSDTSLGVEMKKRREQLELTLREAAALSGISHATLSRIEADLIGLPSRETLTAISRVYQMPLVQLAQLAYCGQPPNPPALQPA